MNKTMTAAVHMLEAKDWLSIEELAKGLGIEKRDAANRINNIRRTQKHVTLEERYTVPKLFRVTAIEGYVKEVPKEPEKINVVPILAATNVTLSSKAQERLSAMLAVDYQSHQIANGLGILPSKAKAIRRVYLEQLQEMEDVA